MSKQSRKVNSMKNMIVGVINQISVLFLNTVLTTIFIRKLGSEYLGVNGLFSNIFVLLSFAELGIGSVMVYCLYEPLAKEDISRIKSIYKYFQKIYFVMTVISTLIGIIILPMLQFIVKTELPINNLFIYYLMFLVSMIIPNMFAYESNLLVANQKKYIVGFYKLTFNAVAIIFQIGILFFTSNYILFLLVTLVKNTVYRSFVIRKVKEIYPYLKTKDIGEPLVKHEKSRILTKIKEVFGYNFAQSLLVGTDNIMISMLVGTVWVGYYSNYNAIIMGVVGLVESMYTAISASVGNFIVEHRLENQYRIFKITEVVNMWIAGFTTTCLFILLQDFIYLWLGKKYMFDFAVLVALLCNYYLTCTRNSIKIFREAAGMFEKVKIAMIFAAAINLILSIILGKLLGVFGVLISTTIAVLSTYYWYEPKLLMENKFNRPLSTYFKGELKCVILTITSIFITLFSVSFLTEITVLSFIVKMGICIIVPNIFYLAVLWRDEGFQQFRAMIFGNKKVVS